jgi:hypothetical protein
MDDDSLQGGQGGQRIIIEEEKKQSSIIKSKTLKKGEHTHSPMLNRKYSNDF